MSVSLGMPVLKPAPQVLAPRRKTRQFKVGTVGIGSESPVSVQSMTTTKTHDIGSTLQQIAELTAAGCDIVRVACPTDKDAEALPIIAKQSNIPVIADIHFQPKYVYAAIKAGCGAVRVNPGNIRKFDDQVKEIAEMASDHGTSIRIGVNAGSLDKRLLEKYGKATPEALVESAVWEASLFEEHGFRDFKISVKHNDPVIMVEAYRQLAASGDWPLHLGVTEAGPAFQGTIKSSVAFGTLLSQGIGDTIRVSLSAPPVEEVKVGTKILESLNLRERKLDIVSCPSCGRAQVNVWELAENVTKGLEGMKVPLRVAVMGCVVNGPGEAREADLGVASGNGKGQIFVKGEVIKTVPEDQIVETLIEEANRIAAEMEVGDKVPSGYAGFVGIPAEGDERDGAQQPNLSSIILLGNNTVPVVVANSDYAVLAKCIHRSKRRLDSIFGPADMVNPLWHTLESRMPAPSSYRPIQPLLYLSPEVDLTEHIDATLPRIPMHLPPLATTDLYDQQVGHYVRFANSADYNALLPAAAAMFREEVGLDPLERYGQGYRNRVHTLSAQQRTVVATNVEGAVVYKADAGLTSLDTAQIQGLWVHPDYRGLGLAASLTAAACALLRRRYRHLSLYVNDYNARARALYARLGWEPVGEYATVIFAR